MRHAAYMGHAHRRHTHIGGTRTLVPRAHRHSHVTVSVHVRMQGESSLQRNLEVQEMTLKVQMELQEEVRCVDLNGPATTTAGTRP